MLRKVEPLAQPHPTQGRHDNRLREFGGILAAFLATRAVIVAVGILAMAFLPVKQGDEYKHLPAGPALDMWYRWDAGFYASVALYRYDWYTEVQPTADMAFFPVYPLAIRAANYLLGCADLPCTSNRLLGCYTETCATITGVLLSNLALLASGWLLFHFAAERYGIPVARRTVWLLMLSPAGVFFSGLYTESFFLLFALLVFTSLDRDRYVGAALAAMLACLTRLVGLALVLPLILHAWQQPGRRRFARLALAALPVLAVATYILYMGWYVGQPLAYFTSNRDVWERTVSTVPFELEAFLSGHAWLWGFGPTWTNLLFTLLYLGLAIAAFRREDRAAALFALAAILIPLSSGSLQSMPRYGAVVFPFYVLLARWADRWHGQLFVYGLSFMLQALFVMRFAAWYFIA